MFNRILGSMANSKITIVKRSLLFLSGLVLLSSYAVSQSGSLGCWLNYSNQLQVTDKTGLIIDYQFRNYSFIHDYEQSIIRGTLYFRFPTKGVQLSAGAAYANTSRYSSDAEVKTNTDENRLHQQLLISSVIKRIHINHRYRLEERFFKKEDKIRFRYMLNVQIPLNKKELAPGAFYISLSNEIFIHNKPPLFDRNRIISEVGYFISPSFRVEAGLLMQLYEKSERAQLRLSVFQTIDFSKHHD